MPMTLFRSDPPAQSLEWPTLGSGVALRSARVPKDIDRVVFEERKVPVGEQPLPSCFRTGRPPRRPGMVSAIIPVSALTQKL